MARESYISPQKFVVFRTAGIVPTIPVPATLRRYHADFLDTDLEIGEWARNIEDNTTFFRNETGIVSYIDRTGIKSVEIGDWNMYITGGGTGVDTKNVAHGLPFANIRGVHVFIRTDAGMDLLVPLDQRNPTTGNVAGDAYINSTAVVMHILTGGTFDSNTFDAEPYNRGWIVLEYVT